MVEIGLANPHTRIFHELSLHSTVGRVVFHSMDNPCHIQDCWRMLRAYVSLRQSLSVAIDKRNHIFSPYQSLLHSECPLPFNQTALPLKKH